jgi:hypothetical protein
VRAEFPTVAGLDAGADVRLGGIRAGMVKRIDLPATVGGKVTVVMMLRNSARSLVRKDSVAAIKTAGLLGDEYVDVSFGSQDAAALDDDALIRSARPVDMTELTTQVASQTKATLASMQEDMDALKQNFLLRGFFNKRGYEDSGELTRNAIAHVPTRAPGKEFDFESSELFDSADTAQLRNERKLREAGNYLEQGHFSLAVVAVSEVLGDSDKQRVLTQAKAMVIRNHLVGTFRLDDKRLKTIGLGKSTAYGETGKVRILVY